MYMADNSSSESWASSLNWQVDRKKCKVYHKADLNDIQSVNFVVVGIVFVPIAKVNETRSGFSA